MVATPVLLQPFSLPGEVVEICEEAGERRARIVLRQPVVLDVPAGGPRDLQLGDPVVVEGTISIDAVRSCTGPGAPGGR